MATIAREVADVDRLVAENRRLVERIEAIEGRLAAMETRIAARPRRRDRDADDALLVAIAKAVGGRVFGSHDLIGHARVDAGLRQAIGSASVKQLGLVLRGIAGTARGDLRLARVKRSDRGRVWQLVHRA